MPNVLSVHLGSDPAGISHGIADAFRDDPDWRVASYTTQQNYIDYPAEPWDDQRVREAWLAADVVHLHHNFVSANRLKAGFVGRRLPDRPYVVEFHGTQYRELPGWHHDELARYGAIGLVSTLDLHLIGGLEWLPAPIPVERLHRMKQPSGERIVIAHAPTNRQIKSTDLFLAAVQRLQDEGYPVDLELIEHRPWAECLERKARADIFFDQVILGYGCNALEAWAMGIPVVAGAQDETLDEMERRFGHLPFYHATLETIYDALKELVESPELRERYGRIGHDYVRKYHDYPVVVEQLKGIYRRAMGQIEDQAA